MYGRKQSTNRGCDLAQTKNIHWNIPSVPNNQFLGGRLRLDGSSSPYETIVLGRSDSLSSSLTTTTEWILWKSGVQEYEGWTTQTSRRSRRTDPKVARLRHSVCWGFEPFNSVTATWPSNYCYKYIGTVEIKPTLNYFSVSKTRWVTVDPVVLPTSDPVNLGTSQCTDAQLRPIADSTPPAVRKGLPREVHKKGTTDRTRMSVAPPTQLPVRGTLLSCSPSM